MKFTRYFGTFAALVTLCACEGMVRRTIEVEHSGGATASTVSKAVGEFAVSQGFTCKEQSGSVVLECRAIGPRFLYIVEKSNSSVVELAQPYPSSFGGPPKDYRSAVDALTAYMSNRFGSTAKVAR